MGSARAATLVMSQTGVLKKFFEEKGFGFVTPDDGGEDVFVHVKDNPSLESCGPGDTVTFDSEWDDRKGKYKGMNVTSQGGGSGGGWGGGGSGYGGGYGGGKSGGKGKGKGGGKYGNPY